MDDKMYISNGEAFVNFDTAAKSYFHDEIFKINLRNEHFSHLSRCLNLYTHIDDIYNVRTTENSTFKDEVNYIPKIIKGMCEVEIDQISDELSTYKGKIKPLVTLKISPYTEVASPDLVGCSITPIINHNLDYDFYLSVGFVHLAQFIEHAKEVGIKINANFLENIIINDDSFRLSKKQSKVLYNGKFNLKQAAKKYLPFIDAVPEQTIIQACKYASATYDRQEIEANSPEKVTQKNIDKIIALFSDILATNENIEQLKIALPDIWQEALFNSSHQVNKKPDVLDGITHTSENLDILKRIVIEFWENKDLEIAAKEATNDVIKAYVKNEYPDISPTLAKNIAMIIRPNKYK